MLFACKCLNVSIVSSSEVQAVDVANLDLSEGERNEIFFNEKIGSIELLKISKEVPNLVKCRNVGSWLIHYCTNCCLNMYAIHKDKGSASILINYILLMDSAEINALKKSSSYSPVFRLILSTMEDEINIPKVLPVQVDKELKKLRQQLNDVINKERNLMQEKIQELNTKFEEFKYNNIRDYKNLAWLLLTNSQMEVIKIQNGGDCNVEQISEPDSAPLASQNTISSPKFIKGLSSATMTTATFIGPDTLSSGDNKSVNSQTKLRSRTFSPSSIDAEGLFALDGMDDVPVEEMHSEEDNGNETDVSDSGSQDEGIDIPKRSALMEELNVAKSHPVNVPSFKHASHSFKEDNLEQPCANPQSIADSIHALAQSVCDDAIFGELPRPKFIR